MTLDLLRDEVWRALGKDTQLDPDTDTSYSGGPLLNYVCNEGQRRVALWKNKVNGKRVQFRNLIADLYFQSKVITGTTAPSGTVANSKSIAFSTTHVGSQSGRYNGWIVSCGSDKRLITS